MKDLLFIKQTSADRPVSADLNDIVLDGNDFATVEGPERKVQDVIKMLITREGSNFVYTGYGSILSTLVGSRRDPDFRAQIEKGIAESFGKLQRIEQSARLDERIRALKRVTLRDSPDPRALFIVIEVELENGQPIRTQFPIIVEAK